MNFPVPWRVLVPIDAVDVLQNHVYGLKEISVETGALLHLSGEGETPATLQDKIVTLSGTVEQKEAACRRTVDKLRDFQDVSVEEPGVVVMLVPSRAVPMVIGQKGSQIKEVIDLSGAEVSVCKESIAGMQDQAIGITGTAGQAVSAVSKINAILQDLADRDRLQPSDFKYRVGQDPRPGGMDMLARAAHAGGNPRTNAKFVVATQIAGWIIGKQGRHIRELQENSGAHIQVLKEGEVPPGVSPMNRVVEIGGRYEAKAEGIQIVLMAIDSMPALQSPRETQLLVLKALTHGTELMDVKQMSGAEVDIQELPGHEEALCTVVGSIEARVKAAQRFLTRLEEVAQDGSLAANSEPAKAAMQPPASSPSKPLVSSTLAAPLPHAQPASFPLAGTDRQNIRTSASDDPWNRADPWSQVGAPHRASSLNVGPSSDTTGSLKAGGQQENPDRHFAEAGSYSTPAAGSMPTAFGDGHTKSQATSLAKETGRPLPKVSEEVPQAPAVPSSWAACDGCCSAASKGCSGGMLSFSSAGSNPVPCGEASKVVSFNPVPCGEASKGMSFNPVPLGEAPKGAFNPAPSGEAPKGMSFPCGQTSKGMSFSPAASNPAPSGEAPKGMSFSPAGSVLSGYHPSSASQGGATRVSFTPDGAGSGCGGLMSFSSAGQFGQMGLGGPLGGFGAAGMNETLMRAAFQEGIGNLTGQLLLLLPAKLLHQTLIPHGHLGEIANACGIRIELGAEHPPNQQVALAGGVVANAMAAYFLQERMLQFGVA